MTAISGRPGASEPAADADADRLERALAAAASEPGRMAEVLSELSRGRVWVPLPEARFLIGADGAPEIASVVQPGGAVRLPTVTYQGGEFVPAFTSAARLREWASGTGSTTPAGRDRAAEIPHLVVAAAALARLLPARLGLAVNPNAGPSVALSPDGVSELARSGPS